MASRKQKTRTYARNRAYSRRGRELVTERDSTFFVKLVICVLLGTLWLKLGRPIALGPVPIVGIPLGFLVGILLIHRFEKLQSDRKIWYATLLIITIVCYFLPAGVVI